MIQKWYEVTCDYCGRGINHYISRKPTKESIKEDGAVCTATHQFCDDECYANWLHDKQERQYMNLRQRGRIHSNE